MIFGSKCERFSAIDSSQLSFFEEAIAEKELEKHTITYQRDKKPKKKEK